MPSSTVTKFEVKITYNGVTKSVTANTKQSVQALLQHALNEFGIRRNRQNHGLFAGGSQPLDTQTSVEDAGITPGSNLLLRPIRVSGG